jgi:hypothetical protein
MTSIGPGVRVKCIKRGPWENIGPGGDWYGYGPAFGTVWTINEVFEFTGEPCVYLREWPEPWHGFTARRFVPVNGSDSELSILRSIAANPSGYIELPSRDIPVPEHELDEVLLP